MIVMLVTVWQWAAQSQEKFVAESSGVDPWLLPGHATWSLPRGVERRPLSRFVREWWSRTGSAAGRGRIVAVTAACRGVMEPHRICRREWSRTAAVTAVRQEVKVCRLKFGRSV